MLIDHFIAKFNRLQGKSVRGIDGEALSLLIAYDWPGNIRELSHAIEHAILFSDGKTIDLPDLPADISNQK